MGSITPNARAGMGALVAVVFLACGTGMAARGDMRAETRVTAMAITDALQAYKAENRALPSRIVDLCPRGVPCSTETGLIINGPLLDAWGRPFVYERTGSSFEIRSAGRDGIWSSADDLAYSPELERAAVARLAGCYEVENPTDRANTKLVLDTVQVSPGSHGYRVSPSEPGGDSWWAPTEGDSIEVSWGKYRIVTAELTAGALRGVSHETSEHGTSRGKRYVARRVTCDLRTPLGQ